jgi:hypothetical protein
MGASQISNDAYAQALRESIERADLFSGMRPDGSLSSDKLHRQG